MKAPPDSVLGEDTSLPNRASQAHAPGVRGLTLRDFSQVAAAGFGDGHNAYAHSMAWFRDHVYVGTTRACLAHRGRWRDIQEINSGLDVWPVPIPGSAFEIDLSAEIWRVDPVAGEWEQVYRAPPVVGKDGFDVPLGICFRSMCAFQGRSDPEPALYVPTMGSHQAPFAYMLRSADGVNFEVVSEAGMGFPEPFVPRGVRGLVPFKNRLFTAPAVGKRPRESNTPGFMIIGVNDDPAHKPWELACPPGFGTSDNLSVFDLATLGDCLYAGTANVREGFQIWKTTADGDPPYRWTRVLEKGAYRGKLNEGAITMKAFNGYLYVGTAIQEGGMDKSNMVGPGAVEILRIAPDDTWEIVVGEPRPTPDGLKIPVSGMNAGFGRITAGYLWSLCEYEGWLYAGTFDWLMFFTFADEAQWPANLAKTLSYIDTDDVVEDWGGCSLWRTRDGQKWVPVTQNGFGNRYNYGVRTMVSTPHGLFVGTANPFGPKVAVHRMAGWRYEDNPQGGLEIWKGSRTDPSRGPKVEPPADNDTSERSDLLADLEPETISAAIQDFYGQSGFRHVGFWRRGVKTPRQACENLMREIVAFLPGPNGVLLDLGCGDGGSTTWLAEHTPACRVVGLTGVSGDLSQDPRVPAQGQIAPSRLPRIDQRDATADAVVWAAGAEELGDRRRLAKEAFRVLKPEGCLSTFDIVSGEDPAEPRFRLWRQHRPDSASAYGAILEAAGFSRVQTIDVTEACLESFRRYVGDAFATMGNRPGADLRLLERTQRDLTGPYAAGCRCLLLFAVKPGAANGPHHGST